MGCGGALRTSLPVFPSGIFLPGSFGGGICSTFGGGAGATPGAPLAAPQQPLSHELQLSQQSLLRWKRPNSRFRQLSLSSQPQSQPESQLLRWPNSLCPEPQPESQQAAVTEAQPHESQLLDR
jgi:hypothetical protein